MPFVTGPVDRFRRTKPGLWIINAVTCRRNNSIGAWGYQSVSNWVIDSLQNRFRNSTFIYTEYYCTLLIVNFN